MLLSSIVDICLSKIKLGLTSIELLPNDAYAGCGGKYIIVPDEHVSWAPQRPVYKHISRDRYIFYNIGNRFDEGWRCGDKEDLSTGSYYVESTYKS